MGFRLWKKTEIFVAGGIDQCVLDGGDSASVLRGLVSDSAYHIVFIPKSSPIFPRKRKRRPNSKEIKRRRSRKRRYDLAANSFMMATDAEQPMREAPASIMASASASVWIPPLALTPRSSPTVFLMRETA